MELMNNKEVMDIIPEKILILRLSAIGDVVRTLPALRALRNKYPTVYIAWVVEENAQDILQGHPDLDRLFIFKRKKWTKEIFSIRNFLNPFKEVTAFFREIRKEHFDLVLDFHGILKSGVISFFSGVPLRAGFSRDYSKECNYLFNNYHITLETDEINRIERNLKFIRFLGIDYDDYGDGDGQKPIIPITDKDRHYIDDFFKEKDLNKHTPLIAIHPGTSKKTPYKRWDISCYATVADKLIERLDANILWTWGPGELETSEAVVDRMRHGSTIACKTENLRQLAEIFNRCNLFLGSDSGPMHIASFVKTPVVAIYGPTNHVVNAPYEKNPHIMLRKDVPCSPCRKRDCKSVQCMTMVKPDEVFDAVKKLLNVKNGILN
jgi:lipopolysaccharide heptosyltransferase I